MPVFNTPVDWLGRAIDSVVRQTYAGGLELVICDDGSDDRTRQWLDRLVEVQRDDRVPIVLTRHQVNQGPSAARNTAAESARGRYLIWLDSDDELSPGAVQAMVDCAQRTGAKMVVSRCAVAELDGSVSVRDHQEYLRLVRRRWRAEGDPLARVVFSVQAQLVETGAFWAIDGFNPKYPWAEVTEFFLRFARRHNVRQIRAIDEVAYRYHRREGSRSSREGRHCDFRRQALNEHWDAIAGPNRPAEVTYQTRSYRTGAQHFEVRTAAGSANPPFLDRYTMAGPARWVRRGEEGLVAMAAMAVLFPVVWMTHSAATGLVVMALVGGAATIPDWVPWPTRARVRRELDWRRGMIGTAAAGLTAFALWRLGPGGPSDRVPLFGMLVGAPLLGYLSVVSPKLLRARTPRNRRILTRGALAGGLFGCLHIAVAVFDSRVSRLISAPPGPLTALVCAFSLVLLVWFLRRQPACLAAATVVWTSGIGALTAIAIDAAPLPMLDSHPLHVMLISNLRTAGVAENVALAVLEGSAFAVGVAAAAVWLYTLPETWPRRFVTWLRTEKSVFSTSRSRIRWVSPGDQSGVRVDVVGGGELDQPLVGVRR
jgi:glycosyltransferase involved in cell wall biosynthesis